MGTVVVKTNSLDGRHAAIGVFGELATDIATRTLGTTGRLGRIALENHQQSSLITRPGTHGP